jgi:hypothetical protein
MPRLEVRGAARHVHEFAVDEPQRVHAARMRPGGIEMGNELWLLRHADVEQVEPRGRQSCALCLIGDGHHIADDVERIRAHLGVRQLGLGHDPRRSRVRHVDAGEILGRGFVREPQHAAAVARELHRHALTDAAKALQLVMGKKAHVQGERLIGTRPGSG